MPEIFRRSSSPTADNETAILTAGLNCFIRRQDTAVSLDYLAGAARLGGRDDRRLGRLRLVF